MRVGLFYLPSIGTKAEIEQGMAGTRDDLYQRMLLELREQAQLADQLGYESISFTEHHFHVEGFEISNNPVLLDLYIGMHTKNIRVGQLGIVLPAANPLRVAEDIAMLDHMTGGRAQAGFARGYQRRWVDTMAQHYRGISATPSDEGEIDRMNRAAFEEFFQILKLAWTTDTFSFKGQFWTIPAEGTPWPVAATKQWGKGVGADDIVREIGTVPKPLQKPYPRIFQPFAFSESTIRWCAREGVEPILSPVDISHQRTLYSAYQDEAAKAGRTLRYGEGMGLLRDVLIADTMEEALMAYANGSPFVNSNWFAPFGFGQGIEAPGEKREDLTLDKMLERGHLLVGTVDSVTRQLETMMKQAPVHHLMAYQYNGFIPHEMQLKSLELFATKVWPRFKDIETMA